MQKSCCTVYHVEPAFNHATEHQAASRIVRIGQQHKVEAIRLFAEGTYQELYEHYMLRKANTMFAAYKELHATRVRVDQLVCLSDEEMAMKAFSIWRLRMRDITQVEAAKRQAMGHGS